MDLPKGTMAGTDMLPRSTVISYILITFRTRETKPTVAHSKAALSSVSLGTQESALHGSNNNVISELFQRCEIKYAI